MKLLKRVFKLEEKQTSISKEMIAALTTFATMAYVLAVQPSAIVGFGADSFVDISGVLITKQTIMIMCALISGVITIFMAFYANLPFALSTGMGTNFLFGAMIQSNEISLAGAMTITLISGTIFVVLTLCGVRNLIVEMIPKNIKIGIGIAVGFFIAYLGFNNSGIGNFANGISLGDFSSPIVLLSLFGFFTIAVLEGLKVRGGILLGILITTIVGLFVPNLTGGTVTSISGIASVPNFSDATNVMFNFDLKSIITWATIPLIFVVFSGDFFSTLGTILGVADRVNMLDEDGNLPGIEKPFLVDAVGTVVGACFGCTTITTFVESSTGVEAGGRSGLTSFFIGILLIISMFFAPLFTSIPNSATGPALIYIGFLMISAFKNLDFSDFTEYFGPFVMIMFAAFAGGIAVGISMGILAHILIKVCTLRGKEIHFGMYILAIPLVIYFISNAML